MKGNGRVLIGFCKENAYRVVQPGAKAVVEPQDIKLDENRVGAVMHGKIGNYDLVELDLSKADRISDDHGSFTPESVSESTDTERTTMSSNCSRSSLNSGVLDRIVEDPHWKNP